MTLDQSVENLRAFCELLRVTNPVLEAGASDLGGLGHSLGDTTTHLSQELDHLATDVDGLQKQAESSQAEAVKACEELGHVAEGVNSTGLAEVEKEAASTQEHWTAVLQETSSALDTAFQELDSQGWEPLDAALAQEQGDFERWTQAADDTLHTLIAGIGSVETAVAHQGTVLDEATRDLEAAAPFPESYWHGVGAHARTLTQETVPQFTEHVLKHAFELNAIDEQLVTEAGEGSTHVRAQVDLTMQAAVSTIDAKDVELMQAVETAAEGLKTAQIEFERGAVQAEDADKAGHDVAELAGHVAEANVQLQQVHEALEALGQ